MEFYKGKRVLVTGGTGTLGAFLVNQLIRAGARVTALSLDSAERAAAVLEDPSVFRRGDLRDYAVCFKAAEGQDFVFHLMAVKGNTQIGVSKVASA